MSIFQCSPLSRRLCNIIAPVVGWCETRFQCSPLSRRLCNALLSPPSGIGDGISVLTPEPKAV